MPDPMLIAKCDHDIVLLPNMANRHGLIAGATGTGKTVTLQVIAEGLSKIGVPVFMADVKGDLAGISQPGTATTRVAERVTQLNLGDYPFAGCPVVFWDVLGEGGHPIRTTVSEMGPLLLARMLNLNETQEGVLHIVFKIADDNGMLLLDLKDLRAMLQYAGDNQADFKTQYGNISAASIGAIQRGLLTLESQSGEKLFGEPALDINDLIQTDGQGRGVINILVADKLMQLPQTYATLLLSILSDLYEELPEVGDPEKPKLVFFFDEAHLLFDDAPKPLLDKIEQVVRLVRSKGVGVYFVSQNPLDIPDEVLGQLGNRVQHALRAFTPRDQKAVKAAAETFRANPKLNVETVISELGVGEALISTLEDKGTPSIVERALVVPPHSQIGPITPAQRKAIITGSVLFGHYENAIDRDSAFEMLTVRAKAKAQEASVAAEQKELDKHAADLAKEQAQAEKAAEKAARQSRPRARQSDNMAEAVMKSTARAAGSQLGRSITRGILGSLFGGRK